MLATTSAATPVFGGNERVVQWRESGVKIDMFVYFLGRDVLATVEIGAAAAFFTMVYWPMGPLLVDNHVMYSSTFAFIYMTYGYSYIASICMEQSTASMVMVLFSFLCFFLSGVEPSFKSLVDLTPGAIYVMAISPIRWQFGYLFYKHLQGTEYTKSQLHNDMIYEAMSGQLRAYSTQWREIKEVGDWSCEHFPETVYNRWLGLKTGGTVIDGNSTRTESYFVSFNCNILHPCLLGVLLRVLAAIILAAQAKVKASGGGPLFERKKSSVSSSFFASTFTPALNGLFWGYCLFFLVFQVVLLCELA